MATNVIPFPAPTRQAAHDTNAWQDKPYHLWAVEDEIAEARFRVSELAQEIAMMDEFDTTSIQYRAKAAALWCWSGMLEERKARASGKVLTHKGVYYAETTGRA